MLRTPLCDLLGLDAPLLCAPFGEDAFAATLRARPKAISFAGGGHDDLPMAGQSAGLIDDVRPAARIIADRLAEALAALTAAHGRAS
jgi:hypothetical protein